VGKASIDRAGPALYRPIAFAARRALRGVNDNPVPELSIIMCTMRRHDFLRELLGALLAQTGIPPDHEVVVVDNDRLASARDTVDPIAATSERTVIRYLHEPRPGVSHARNAGVIAARAPVVLFLDDDQLVPHGFLVALWAAWNLRPTHQRGLRLRLDAHFEPGVCAGSDQSRHLTGLAVADYAPVERGAFGTGGLIVERAVLLEDPEPFRPELGISGGEDTDLFLRASERGYHFGHLTSVAVAERVTHDRAGLDYQLLRQFRSGQLDAALDLAADARLATLRLAQRPRPDEARHLITLRRRLAGERDGWGGIAPPGRLDPIRPAIRSALRLRYPLQRVAHVFIRWPRVALRGRSATELELQHLAYVAGRLHANLMAFSRGFAIRAQASRIALGCRYWHARSREVRG